MSTAWCHPTDRIPLLLVKLKCARTKTTAAVKVIGDEMHAGLVDLMKESMFAMIVDEATEITVKEQVGFAVRRGVHRPQNRWFLLRLAKNLLLRTAKSAVCEVRKNQGRREKRWFLKSTKTTRCTRLVRLYDVNRATTSDYFYALCECARPTAEAIFGCFRRQLEENNIPMDNVFALATDGTNVMRGRRNSFMSRLRAEQPYLFSLHCSSHVAHLCASAAVKKIP